MVQKMNTYFSDGSDEYVHKTNAVCATTTSVCCYAKLCGAESDTTGGNTHVICCCAMLHKHSRMFPPTKKNIALPSLSGKYSLPAKYRATTDRKPATTSPFVVQLRVEEEKPHLALGLSDPLVQDLRPAHELRRPRPQAPAQFPGQQRLSAAGRAVKEEASDMTDP